MKFFKFSAFSCFLFHTFLDL
jgi:hypothetical protein